MTTAIVWFRQDLRLQDNPAFLQAATVHEKVVPLYILDRQNSLLGSAQAWWLHHSLQALHDSLNTLGLQLILRQGNPLDIILQLANELSIHDIYWNRCYEPKTIQRDKKIKENLEKNGIHATSFNGSLLIEPWTMHNKQGDFFKVFTPYWKACRNRLSAPPKQTLTQGPKKVAVTSEALATWKLLPTPNWAVQFPDFWVPGEKGAQARLHQFMDHSLNGYSINRDFPPKDATSRLSPHLHFGEISPWAIFRAIELAQLDPQCDLTSTERFLSELGWREFSYYLLYHFPQLMQKNFKAGMDAFPWHNDESLFTCWKKGETGYPIVDAGMRELWATGYMHNRVRMIAASFLIKDLFIDWRLGADWFLDTLVDADLANNSASWQWVAGSGADATPYFRIFNPVLQSQKFDAHGDYIRRWVPELSYLNSKDIHAPWQASNCAKIYEKTHYPRPIVDHSVARHQALHYYHQLQKKDKT